MTKDEVLQQVADRYRSQGYRVTVAAGTGVLPAAIDHLRQDVDLIAQKEGGFVAIEVKRRDRLYEISPLHEAVGRHLPGWSYDLVVFPPDGVDGVPLADGESSREYLESLLFEADELISLARPRAAFLVAWAAIESAMRVSAQRVGLEISDGAPRFVLKTLYSNGVISFDDYEKLRLSLDERNKLLHGLAADGLEPRNARFILKLARQLLAETPA
jgi:hypothetical protein